MVSGNRSDNITGMAIFYYEDTRTGNRFQDARPDLADIPALHLKRIEADGSEVKPKVSLPITPEKIKAAKSVLKPSTTAPTSGTKSEQPTHESEED